MENKPCPSYCIIDIETTGGSYGRNRITEIGIVKFDGQSILEKYSTLINPEMSIPYHITQLTGISNEMVEDAPRFYEVAKKIVQMTENSIFVAHNVFFDYNFIQSEFRDLGYQFKRDKMCTVRLSRKILPGHTSYSLGNLCQDLRINIQNRHRALGDAEATTHLFKLLIEKSPELIQTIEATEAKKLSLPPFLEKESYDSPPNRPGVYFFWNNKNELLYIGKSKEIKKRVTSHFRLNIKRQKDIELKNNVRKITYQETGTDFIARVLECHLIKKMQPFFNVSMRKNKYPYELTLKYDNDGLASFRLSSTKSFAPEAILFKSKNHGKKTIEKFFQDHFGLNLQSHFFENQRDNFIKTLGVDNYNKKFEDYMQLLQYPQNDFKIKFKGREKNEYCFLSVINGKLARLEFISNDGELDLNYELEEDTEMRSMFTSFISQTNPQIMINRDDDDFSQDYEQYS